MIAVSRTLPELLAGEPLLMAPLAGITDKAFRHLALEHGAALTYSEMISITGLDYGDRTTWSLTEPADNEEHFAIQLFGAEPERVPRVVERLMDRVGEKVALIDINMACPVRKVMKRGEGSALMRTPEIAAGMISAVREATDVPVTAKIRVGFERGVPLYREVAVRLVDAGAAAIALHGRSATQLYRDTADWDPVAELAATVPVPVIGSGDVTDAETAIMRSDTSGADAIFAARGALGNPWIFSRYRELKEHGKAGQPTTEEKLAVMRRHIELHEWYGGNPVRLRKDLAWYVSGMPFAARKRRSAMMCDTFDDLRNFVMEVESDVG